MRLPTEDYRRTQLIKPDKLHKGLDSVVHAVVGRIHRRGQRLERILVDARDISHAADKLRGISSEELKKNFRQMKAAARQGRHRNREMLHIVWRDLCGLAPLGALLARGHPITVLSALVAAPLTSLNPTIAAGMVTGLVESWLRKPRVSDLENLRFDITTVKGWFRNPATRILLVFFLSNLGSAIGTWVAGFRIFGELSM